MRKASTALAAAVALGIGALLGAVVVGGLGVALGYALFADDDVPSGVPRAVEETRAALLETAKSGDYEKMRPLVPGTGFEYTFGGPVDGGPIAYWQELERTTGERPLEALAEVLRMPYTLARGLYVWPFAYDVAAIDDLTAHERELLAPLGPLESVFVEGTGYLGWRAGIQPDGTWIFFVAGD